MLYIKGILTLIILYIFLPCALTAQTPITIRGTVTDSVTHEVLPFITIIIQGTTNGTETDKKGKFYLKDIPDNAVLVFTSLGYEQKRIDLKKENKRSYNVRLAPVAYMLSEMVITPKKEKYRKKNNPAVAFVKKIIENKDRYDPELHDYYQYERYEKMTFALSNFTEKQQKRRIYRRIHGLRNYIDTSRISDRPIFLIGAKELIEENYYRKSPEEKKKVIKGIKQTGIDELFPKETVKIFLDEVFKETDIYKNNVSLFLNRFVSPLSTAGPSFYKYYLLDTLEIDGVKCVDLGFVPFHSESFGFTGHLYTTLDNSWFVKKVSLSVPEDINLNFVDRMTVEQHFSRLPDGTRLITEDDITAEFKLAPHTQGIYVKRTNHYRNYLFDTLPPDTLFQAEASELEQPEALHRTDEFWETHRPVPLTAQEDSVQHLTRSLRQQSFYHYAEKIITILTDGYIATSSRSKFDFGPINTLISGNSTEGVRFRIGGISTANLSDRLFGRGYIAYGTRDHKFKYGAALEYSFRPKKMYANEFPVHSLTLSYSYDLNQLGQQYIYTNKDNVFIALKRKKDKLSTYLRQASVKYNHEYYSGFSYTLSFRHRTEYATPALPFREKWPQGIRFLRNYSMSEFELGFRYAYKEKFYQTKSSRHTVTPESPVITLSHIFAHKGFIGADYSYNRTEAAFRKRIRFSAYGYTDLVLKAGKVWDAVPFPLLLLPDANLSYTMQPESYTLLNAMEFINDQYIACDLTYFMSGLILNHIPLIKRLKWREIFTFKCLYGGLTHKNNPAYGNPHLYLFPAGSYVMGNAPYMEIGIGLENIFRFLRLDYVWRLNYRNHPDISKSGLRVSLHIAF